MIPHFPSAEPQTASETGRWFLCCPLWWQWYVSRSPVPVLWLLTPWTCCLDGNWEKDVCAVKTLIAYFAILFTACLAAAPCTVAAEIRCDSAKVSGTVTSQAIAFHLAQGIRVAPSGRLPSLLKRPAGFTGICTLSRLLFLRHSPVQVSFSFFFRSLSL